jgi:DNA excision repair protein ERCC-4
MVGYQRKTLPDLQNSLLDGRLYRELSQLQASASITYAFLIIESDLRRTIDGTLLDSTLTMDSLRSIIAKFEINGVGYLPTDSTGDTARCIHRVSTYIGDDSSSSVRRPKQLKNEWGLVTSESYALWLLQSFPNIGPKQARAIYTHFGGVPIKWTVGVNDLIGVPGIGRKTAEALLDALANP